MNTSLLTRPLAFFRRLDRLAWWIVVMPTALALLYYGLIASDVYISESRFLVRAPKAQVGSTLGTLLQGAGMAHADADAYAVENYVLSRDAAWAVDQALHIRAAYGRHGIDVLSRFPGLDWDDSFESFFKYYQHKVEVQVDSASSVATLKVRAYTAADAEAINQALLAQAEALVNRLNERSRQDLVRYAAAEADDLGKKAQAAALALARYRNQSGVIDPERQSAIPLERIAKLQERLIDTKAAILDLQAVAAANPQLPLLRNRAQQLQVEIDHVSQGVTGGAASLASKAPEYQRFALEKEFADKMLASGLGALEQARAEAQRQQLYIERIVQPNRPDQALEPRRLRIILTVLALGLVAWGVISMLVAGIREHQD